MRIVVWEFTRSQRYWVCRCTFTTPTIRQFTEEEHTVMAGGRWLWQAWWRCWRTVLSCNKIVQAKLGERSAIGWGE